MSQRNSLKLLSSEKTFALLEILFSERKSFLVRANLLILNDAILCAKAGDISSNENSFSQKIIILLNA